MIESLPIAKRLSWLILGTVLGCNTPQAFPPTEGTAEGGAANEEVPVGGQPGVGGQSTNNFGGAINGSIESLISPMDHLKINVNLADGFIDYENDIYSVDLSSGHVDYLHVARPRSGEPVTITDAVDATPEQIAALVATVRAAQWREQPECPGAMGFIDGAPIAPWLAVTAGQQTVQFWVSDANCHGWSHGAQGKVIHCAAFDQIFNALLAIRPGGSSASCQTYW